MTYYKGIWLGIYVVANLVAAITFGITGYLDGDLVGFPVPSYSILLGATVSVVISYLLWMGPIFNIMASFKVDSLISSWKNGDISYDARAVGIFVFLVQFSFFLFNIHEGVNVAGSRLQSDSPVRHLWVLLVPDALFLVYYAVYRKSRLFASNLVLYMLSNAMRGWLGTWMIIFFIEGAYRVREGRLKWKKVLITIGVFALFLPVLVELKWTIREVGTSGVLDDGAVLAHLLSFLTNMNWFDAFASAIQPIVMRFQHLANVIAIIGSSSAISSGLLNREFLYFFEEGLPQYTLATIFGNAGVPDIHLMLLTYLIPDQLPVDTITNTHVGLVGWFWIAPQLFALYVFYLLLISWLGIWLSKKAGGDGLLMDVVWFAWLGLLMNGWLAAYIGFMQALVVLMCIRLFVLKIKQAWASRELPVYASSSCQNT